MPGPEHASAAVTWGGLALAILSIAVILVGGLLSRLIRAQDDKLTEIVKDNHASNAQVRSSVEKIGVSLDSLREAMAAHASRIAVGDQRAQELHARLTGMEVEVRGLRDTYGARLEAFFLEATRMLRGGKDA